MRAQIRLLGRFEVVVDGQPVPARSWRRQAASRLVKLLALQPGYRLHREQVIDALWPDVPLDTGATRLHTAAHYARTALGDPDSIVVSQGVVALFPDQTVWSDYGAGYGWLPLVRVKASRGRGAPPRRPPRSGSRRRASPSRR